MICYVSWRVDGIDGRLATMFAVDNAAELTKISQLLNKAARDVHDWAISVMGNVILDGVWQGAFCVPATELQELAKIRDRYQSFTNMTLAMGVGMSLAESTQALEHTIHIGGDAITFWTQELDHVEEESEDSMDISGLEDISKAEASEASTSSQEPSSSDQAPTGTRDAPVPQQAQPPPSAPDGDQAQGAQDPREQIMAALKEIKAAAPAIESLKDRNPQAYQAIKDTVGAMIVMANGIMAKSEKARKEELSPSETPDEETSVLDKEELGEKQKRGLAAGLPAVGAVNGSVKDGKIKDTPVDPVTTQAQPTKWHGARSGMVTSNFTGAAVSSRRQNDSGK